MCKLQIKFFEHLTEEAGTFHLKMGLFARGHIPLSFLQ
jgi:hypothetical protein